MASSTLELKSDGYGDGYGYGYGYGDGYGYGYGYGAVSTEAYADHPLVKQHTADGSKVELGLWRSNVDARPVNGGSGEAVYPGLLQEMAGPLRICSRGFHATNSPGQWSGERWWVVALFEPIQRQDDKFASLKRLIVEELT